MTRKQIKHVLEHGEVGGGDEILLDPNGHGDKDLGVSSLGHLHLHAVQCGDTRGSNSLKKKNQCFGSVSF